MSRKESEPHNDEHRTGGDGKRNLPAECERNLIADFLQFLVETDLTEQPPALDNQGDRGSNPIAGDKDTEDDEDDCSGHGCYPMRLRVKSRPLFPSRTSQAVQHTCASFCAQLALA